MADVGSLGEYKVVVTADYSQLKTQFDAMSNFVSSTTKVMSDNLNKTMGGINATMISQLKTTVDQLKKSFDGLDTTTKKSGDGFKTYAQQIKEAEKAAQKCHQEISALQKKMATSSMSNEDEEKLKKDVAKLNELKARFREIREHTDSLKAAQADYNMRIKETQNLEAMAAKAKKQADQEGLKALREQAKEAKKIEEAKKKAEETAAKKAEAAAKKAGDGFKSYSQQIKAVNTEMEKAFQKVDDLQTRYNLISNDSVRGRSDLAYLKESKLVDTAKELKEATAEAERFRIQHDMLVESQKRFKEYAEQTQTAQKEQIREAVAGANAQIKALDREGKNVSRILEARMRAKQEIEETEKAAQKLGETTKKSLNGGAEGFKAYAAAIREEEKAAENFRKQQGQAILAAEERAIAGRTAAHKAGWEEIIRQEKIAAQEAVKAANQQAQAIENLNSRYTDFFTSLKHHLTWMASAIAIGTVLAIPAKTISTIADVEKQMAAMKQVNHDVNSSQEVLNKTTQDFIGIAQQYGHSVDEIIKAGTLWGRQYKQLDDVMKLTNLSAKLAVADNMDIGLANRAVESVINGYQRQGDAVNFANHVVDSWTKIAHNAQSSATDLAEALMRTGAAAKAVGVDFDTTNALASAMIKSTGRSGAEVGRPKLAA